MKFLYLIFFVFAFSSCKTNDNNVANTGGIEGTWTLSNYTSGEQEEKGEKYRDLEKLGMVLSLFADQTYTMIIGNGDYITGRWKYVAEANKLTLIPAGKNPVQLSTIIQTFNKKATLSLTNTRENSTMFLVRSGLPIKDFKEDPYYQQNNTWRIRSAKADSAATLQSKLENLLQHYIYILKAAKERKSRVVSFEFSKSLISIYNGGIGILPKDDIDPMWVKTFFSEADAMKVYDMYNNSLSLTSFKGETVGNWMEDDYNILQSILVAVKQNRGKL